jgi:hypothetical protein
MGELGKAELAAATLRKSDPPSNTLFGARISFTQSGGPAGTRTRDTLLKSLIHDTDGNRLTEVKQLAHVQSCLWLLGTAAVICSRQDRP